jgi:maltoporin
MFYYTEGGVVMRTKMNRIIKVVLVVAVFVLGLGGELALAVDIGSGVDFNGYFRTGAGQNSKSGRQASFQLPGADAKYRLGNESDMYGDFLFSKTAWQSSDGSKFKVSFQPSLYTADLSGDSFTVNGNSWMVTQLYVEGKNIPELRGSTAWMGRRYYKREDVHINDYFYHNPSGTGAGIEDFPVFKEAKLSYAFFRNNGANDKEGASRHDLQLRDIPLYEGGSLETGAQFINNDGANVTGQNHSGYNAFVRHIHTFKDLGTNKLTLTYGVGPGTGTGNTSSLLNSSEFKATRVVDSFAFQATRDLGGQLVAGYVRNDNPAGDSTWITVGGRLAYAFTDHLKLLGELGHDQVKAEGQASRSLTKLTIAPTIALARDFWARPELRLYYTYANWNNAAQTASAAGSAMSTTGVFGSATNGSNYGVQVEAWW